LLAAGGMTGPAHPFAGEHGLDALAGRLTLPPLPGRTGPFRIMETTLKCFASEGHSLSPITAALALSQEVRAEDIQQVNVRTYRFAWNVIGSGPEKWRPSTRESADHSMPYVIANALIDGRFTDEAFAPQRLRDPALHALMDRITVREDPELTRQAAEGRLPCRIEIVTLSGERKVAATDYPRGHYRNPMSDAEIEDKFRYNARRALSEARIEQVLATLWKIDFAPNLDTVFSLLNA
jgi:2-methylcitrate dehydratase